MGCKCKEDSEKLSKYTEDGKPALEPLKGFRKVMAVTGSILLGILFLPIVIVALPLLILIVIIATMFGRKVNINLKKIFKLNVGK